MNRTKQFLAALAAALVAGTFAAAALADGMIVPVRPDIRVSGAWAVKYHRVSIKVRDQVASVSIDQEFVNTSSGMIEVEYLFPVPPNAAIDSMTLMVNGKEFAARLLKADEARRIYEDIVRKKKDPALLEYAGFGLYRTKAFPLEPGKPARVLVTYKNVCKKDRDLVEVWYPLNTEKFSAKPIEDVEVKVDIKSRSDITTVYSPTHDLTVRRDPNDPRHVVAVYHAQNTLPTTDFQVFYKAANEAVGATLLTYQPNANEDGCFMLLVSPNPRTARDKVVPKDVVVVFDHSGSMSGEKIEQAKKALAFILNNLNEGDRFNVIAYNDTVEPFFEGLVAAGSKVKEALERLDAIQATGGTNIHEALLEAMRQCFPGVEIRNGSRGVSVRGSHKSNRPSYIIFLTDGKPTVGRTDEKTILGDTKAANAAGAKLFAFGVGYDVNVRLLDKLVRDNSGRSDYVKPKEPIETKISSLYAKIKNPVMMNLKVRIEGISLRDMYPREIGDLFEGDQIVLVGRYDVGRDGLAIRPDGSVHTQLVITGLYEGKERGFECPVRIGLPGRETRFAFVEKLWAMRRVGFLLDQIQLNGESKEVIDELVRLSMAHGIVTPYTSFLADETVRLSRAGELRGHARRATSKLASDISGAEGQVAAMNRQRLNEAERPPAAKSATGETVLFGYSDKDSYEQGKAQTVANVRQVGRQALYRRGRLWVAANATEIDPEKDAERIKTVERFGEEYFALVSANTTGENEVLASQQAGEDLLIKLRGQVYRIK